MKLRTEFDTVSHVDLLELPGESSVFPPRPSTLDVNHPLHELSKMPKIFKHVADRVFQLNIPPCTRRWYKRGLIFFLHPDKYPLLPSEELYTDEECRRMIRSSYFRINDLFNGTLELEDRDKFLEQLAAHRNYLADERSVVIWKGD